MRFSERFSKFNKDIKRFAGISIGAAYIDLFISAAFFGASFDDYIRYRFFEKSLKERDAFVTYLRSRRIIKEYNNSEKTDILSDKAKFNEYFKEYINRDWINLNEANTDNIKEFLLKHEKCICKPRNSAGGYGIETADKNSIDDIGGFLNKKRNCLLEELIIQHPEMSKMNPSSVNTVRIITINRGESIDIIAATVRAGAKESCVDNVNSGGTAASIDMETGQIFTEEMDEEFNRYSHHPGTNVCLMGKTIPNWECVKTTAIKCARLIPEVRYIGWDIAVTENGCTVIEGNHNPAHSTYQEMDQVGKYYQIIGKR